MIPLSVGPVTASVCVFRDERTALPPWKVMIICEEKLAYIIISQALDQKCYGYRASCLDFTILFIKVWSRFSGLILSPLSTMIYPFFLKLVASIKRHSGG